MKWVSFQENTPNHSKWVSVFACVCLGWMNACEINTVRRGRSREVVSWLACVRESNRWIWWHIGTQDVFTEWTYKRRREITSRLFSSGTVPHSLVCVHVLVFVYMHNPLQPSVTRHCWFIIQECLIVSMLIETLGLSLWVWGEGAQTLKLELNRGVTIKSYRLKDLKAKSFRYFFPVLVLDFLFYLMRKSSQTFFFTIICSMCPH